VLLPWLAVLRASQRNRPALKHVREADLDALAARLASGDRTAFDPLYAALLPRALRLATMKMNADAAPDVAQNALLKVFARASEFEPGRACLPWFYAIVANEIQTARRKTARDVPSLDIEITADGDPETEMVQRELTRSLDLAIEALDEPSARAIAAMLGREPMPAIASATFRKRVSRAYAKLRLMLGGSDVR
jgi:RNA polymerase sigma-70 factor (ECF subfamily)